MYFIMNFSTLVTIQPVAVQSNVHPSLPRPQTSLPICRQITTAPLPSYSLQAYLFQTSSQIDWNLAFNNFVYSSKLCQAEISFHFFGIENLFKMR